MRKIRNMTITDKLIVIFSVLAILSLGVMMAGVGEETNPILDFVFRPQDQLISHGDSGNVFVEGNVRRNEGDPIVSSQMSFSVRTATMDDSSRYSHASGSVVFVFEIQNTGNVPIQGLQIHATYNSQYNYRFIIEGPSTIQGNSSAIYTITAVGSPSDIVWFALSLQTNEGSSLNRPFDNIRVFRVAP